MKNKTRITILFVLLVLNALLFFFGNKGRDVSFDEDLFAVTDTAGVTSVHIAGVEGEVVNLAEAKDGWQVNETYQADEGLMRVLLSILNRVQVKKPVDLIVPDDAVEVGVSGADPMSLYVWGNPTKTRTFFSLKDSDEAYEVAIPGYNEYIAGIFELNTDQWRDRLIMNESWRTIQELRLDYTASEEKDFSIVFDQDFYKMEKVEQMDSSAVVDYLNQFQYFQTNEWVSSGRFPKYDSLSKTPPMATLKIESINSDRPISLDIYSRLPGDRFYLLSNQHGDLFVVDQGRVSNVLKRPEDFALVPSK